MPEDIKVLWDGFVESSNERFNEMLKNPSLITILDWLTYGWLTANEQRGEKMLEDPSFYNIGNWLTMGLFDTIKRTFNPEDPLSLQHWLDSLGTAGTLIALYELYQYRANINNPENVIEKTHLENQGRHTGDIADDTLDDVIEGKGKTVEFKGKTITQNNELFDPNYVDEMGRTNTQRMRQGLAPKGYDGKSINIHHVDQTNTGPVTEISGSSHTQDYSGLHSNTGQSSSQIDRNAFNQWRSDYWKWRANDFN